MSTVRKSGRTPQAQPEQKAQQDSQLMEERSREHALWRTRRARHQPSQVEARPDKEAQPSPEKLRAACRDLAALVLARDAGSVPLSILDENGGLASCKGADGSPASRPLQLFEGATLVERTVEMLRACGIKSIEVSTAECLYDEIASILGAGGPASETRSGTHEGHNARSTSGACNTGSTRKDKAYELIVTAYDPEADRTATLEHCGFEVFNLGFGTLLQARDLAVRAQAEGVMIIPCDLAAFKPHHVLTLANALREHADVEVVASWITWLNRPPYLLRRSFLDVLEESPRVQARKGSIYRPLPQLKTHEVVFGEEMLAAMPEASDPAGAFFAHCSLSALEAVRAVRAEQSKAARAAEGGAHRQTDDPKAAQQNAVFSGQGAAKASASDALLMELARKTLAAVDRCLRKNLTPEDLNDIDLWSAWGARNKLDFPLFEERTQKRTLAYLDSAATTQRVGRALAAQYRFDAYENANIYRGAYALSAQSTATFNEARKRIEEHLGAERRSVIFTANTSTAAGIVASAWGEHNIGEGDRILVPQAEHHSNLVPWLMLAERKGAHVDYIPSLSDGRLDMDAFLRALEKRPKLVCAAHITNVTGLVNPVEEMAAAAHEVGARMYVDAAQSFPHLALDVQELGCDFLAFSAHKAYGPMGIGGLWIAPAAFDEMDPLVGGGGTVSHVGADSYYLRGKAIQYELGTPPVSQAIGFAAAVEYLDELGMDAVARHSAAMTRLLVNALRSFDGITIWGDHEAEDGLSGLVAFSQAGVAANRVAAVLGKLGVAVRAGGHCSLPLHASLGLTGSIRFSFGVHTTREDVEAGLVALAVCRRIYGMG